MAERDVDGRRLGRLRWDHGFVATVRDDSGSDGLSMAEQRRAATVAFLSAGLSPPSTALLVSGLTGARRAVAMHRARGVPIDAWLAEETRLPGIRENAAVLAVMEVTQWRAETADRYRHRHPDRAALLDGLLAALAES